MRPYTIFCFPFAGGSRYSFLNFAASFHPAIELRLLESPGHGNRFAEPLLYSMQDIAGDLYEQVMKAARGPFAFWGHSMGAITAFLVSQLLQQNGGPLPAVLFASGSTGIPAEKKEGGIHTMSAENFWEAVIALGALTNEILSDDGMKRLIEPVLRADLTAIENFGIPHPSPVAIPVVTMNGDMDNRESVIHQRAFTPWDQLSQHTHTNVTMKGDHFFIYQNILEMKLFFTKSMEKICQRRY